MHADYNRTESTGQGLRVSHEYERGGIDPMR